MNASPPPPKKPSKNAHKRAKTYYSTSKAPKAEAPPITPREVAWNILQRISPSEPIQAQFTKERVGALSDRDTGLATELVYGTMRALPRLTFLVSRLVPNPENLPPPLHQLLCMALYECLFLDRIPPHATVHSAVDLAEKRFGKSLAKLTNAALRHFLRLEQAPHCESYYTDLLGETVIAWATFYAIPQWIADLWVKAYGEERAKELAKASATSPWSTVRVNAARQEWEALRTTIVEKTEGHSVGYAGVQYLPAKSPEFLREYIKTGKLSLQGAGSQEVLAMLNSQYWPSPIWDACAGHGGKTMALMEQGCSCIAASDTNKQRLRGLRDDAKRLVLTPPPLFCASATAPALRTEISEQVKTAISQTESANAQAETTKADNNTPNRSLPIGTVLLDVPCSGLGTLARHPDLRLSRKPEHLPPLVLLQERMLDAMWPLLSQGACLAYITCTMNPDENEHQIARFLARHKNATLSIEWQSTPDAYGTDMMYAALLTKHAND